MGKSVYRKLQCDFKIYRDTRKKHNLPFYTTCQLCRKDFELNSSLFVSKDEKVICKKCYINFSK